VTATERNMLLKKFLDMFNLKKRVLYWINVNSSGKNLGGYELAWPSGIKEAETIHIKGARVTNPVAAKKTYNIIFFIIQFLSEILTALLFLQKL
jgi:hypothetical protein